MAEASEVRRPQPAAAVPTASGAAPVPPSVAGTADVPDLLHGGLLYRLVTRFGVDSDRASRAARRAALTGLALWAPPALLSIVEGNAFPGRTAVPFFLDVAAYVRPLVVVPVLLVSEVILSASWHDAGRKFKARGLVGPEALAGYERLVERITRSVRRTLPELLCLAVTLVLACQLASRVTAARVDFWFALPDGPSSSHLTLAGVWFLGVHAFMLYLVVRWLWILSLWYRFLWGVARLPLTLHPVHPDRAGGLGFIGRTVSATAPIAFALSASIAASVANRMIHDGRHLFDFAVVGVVVLATVLLLFVLPPAVIFLPLLVRTRRNALEDWSGRLALRADGVDVAGVDPGMALQDVDVGVAAVRRMLPVPIGLSHLIGPVVGTALPAVALVFVAFPVRDVFDQVLRLLV